MGLQRVKHDRVTFTFTLKEEGLMLKLKLQYFGHLMRIADSLERILMLAKIEGKREKWVTEDEMVG